MCLEAKRPRQGPSAGTPSGPAAPAGPAFGGPSTGLTSPPPTHLEAYLPQEMCAAIRATGSKAPAHLYGWQAECLCRPGVLQGRNLVYCAPTSGGKSLVAEILMLRRIILTGRPVLLVLPFISLCAEKAAHLRRLLAPLERDVLDFYGAQGSAAIGRSTGVIVSTMEKANILLNRLLEEKQVGLLSSVCIDELHMVGDLERGYQLELLLTKLRYAGVAAFPFSSTSDSNTSLSPGQTALERGVQIVGMSATLPNVDAVARWLCAELYVTKFRPVPLRQFLKVGTDIQDESGVVVRQLAPPTEWEKKDPDHVAWLAREAVSEGHSVLIFCASRAACSRTAIFLASMLEVPQRQLVWQPPPDGALAALLPTDIPPCRRAFVEALRRNEAAHPELLAAVEKGIAFHHAGLDSEERELVEGAYKCGAVSVLCATSTLAAGVNLPARRVIFRHPYVGTAANLLDPTKYRQMAGRAGRAGIDTEGEAFLLVLRDAGATKLQALMRAGPTPIESCLTEDRKGMKRAMLEVVASGAVTRPTDVERYIRCTLLAATNSFALVAEATKAALVWLGHKEQGFVYWDEPTGKDAIFRAVTPSKVTAMFLQLDLPLKPSARCVQAPTSPPHSAVPCLPAACPQSCASISAPTFRALGTPLCSAPSCT